MTANRKVKQEHSTIRQIAILAAGDILVLLLFVWIGRGNHALSLTDIVAGLKTAAPFVLGWFLAAPWFGLFRAEVNQSWRLLLWRLLIAWLVIGGPISLILRNLFLGRAWLGVIPSFAIVTLSMTTVLLLIWRLGYTWQHHRQSYKNQTAGGA